MISPELRQEIEREVVASFTDVDCRSFSSSDKARILAICDRASIRAAELAFEHAKQPVCVNCGDSPESPACDADGDLDEAHLTRHFHHETVTRAEFERLRPPRRPRRAGSGAARATVSRSAPHPMKPALPLPRTGIVRRESPTLTLVTELAESDRQFYVDHFTRRGWTQESDEMAAGYGADLAFARNEL